jgi:acyl transferase domain-containing protein
MSAEERNLDGVAIVGMSCRFPGARNVEEFWENLLAGRESITFFQPEELDPSIPEDVKADPNYVRARGIVDDCDKFDARFFGISPAEATVMDPQQRLMLEVGWEALENAGCNKDRHKSIGIFAGTGVNTYYVNNVLRRPDLVDSFGEFNVITANDKDYVTTRISYKLDLRGPSVDIQTACSTSLVSVTQAFWALMTWQCDVALAGGASIDVPVNAGYLYEEGSMLSADGHCRPFDADASGTLFNSGVGVVVLKRLEDALRDRDRVYAVIRGAAVNNDGQDKVSFSAPSVNGQSDVITQALDQAAFSADTISYVEAHGTATPLGDPIEIEALTRSFRRDTDAKQFCGIGSVKGNVGHLVAAAGVAGLIKTSLALYHAKIPSSINYRDANPEIDFASSPFRVITELAEWPAGTGPRRAGVSSFGVGGTNAHVVLEEWSEQPRSEVPLVAWQVLPLSAKTQEALEKSARKLAAAVSDLDDASFADTAFTLQTGRAGLALRRFVVARSPKQAAEALLEEKPEAGNTGSPMSTNPSVGFLFPGQGSQHARMAAELYRSYPLVRETIERCAETLRADSGTDLIELLYGDATDTAAGELKRTVNAQPALFAVEYALARLWMSLGVNPAALIGHSVGEFVAACIAGVFSEEDALRVVARRAALMENLPPGAMLSVRAAHQDIAELVQAPVSLAAINGPAFCVLSGPADAIEGVRQKLEKRNVLASVLQTSHAFHSAMMQPAVDPLVAYIEGIELNAPAIPLVSTATGTWLSAEEAVDPGYWGRQLLQPVRFGPAVEALVSEGLWVLVECGPRRAASQLARQQLGLDSVHRVVSTLGDESGDGRDLTNFLKAVGNVWTAGVEPSWSELHAGAKRAKRPLPTYPFERKRYWVDIAREQTERAAMVTMAARPEAPEAKASAPGPAGKAQMKTKQRLPQLMERVRAVFAEMSGLEPAQVDTSVDFVEQGFDSLFLTQAASAIKKDFKVKITFRELMESLPNIDTLARHLDDQLPPEAQDEIAVEQASPDFSQPPTAEISQPPDGGNMKASDTSKSATERLLQRQLDIMQEQLRVLAAGGVAAKVPGEAPAQPPPQAPAPARDVSAAPKDASAPSPRAGTKISKQSFAMTAAQSANLQDFVRRYNARTRKSKKFAQAHRPYFADPRTASGFRPAFKEMVYQIVIARSKGARLWDVDGNEYIDLLNGFGSNMLGHLPDYVREALHAQTDLGLEIGPQTALAGEVAKLFCELSGMERMAFSNTGSEAVAGAIRIARTVTARNLVVTFDGDYHGIFDEVLVRGSPSLKTLATSPGVNRESVQNMLVLPFNDDNALQVIREQADDVAGILVECVQGGDPGVHAGPWLKKLRGLATEIGAALICDEVITGFRIHPRGAQGYFDIEADLATYGKVAGGGLPIGIIAGKAAFMDALDGGQWQFGDNSIPEAGVTYFAGTFVRHPLTMAASRAALQHLKDTGPALQENLNRLADEFVADMNGYFRESGAPWWFENFGSLMNLKTNWDSPFQELLYYALRDHGIHIWNGRPCFLTTAHSRDDLQEVKDAFRNSVGTLVEMGFLELPGRKQALTVNASRPGGMTSMKPPVDGARLGRDKEGNPGWFVADPDRPGKYLQVGV